MDYKEVITIELKNKIMDEYKAKKTFGEIGNMFNLPREVIRMVVNREIRELNRMLRK